VRKTATAPRLVLLVTAAVFINYIDRGYLATAPRCAQYRRGIVGIDSRCTCIRCTCIRCTVATTAQ